MRRPSLMYRFPDQFQQREVLQNAAGLPSKPTALKCVCTNCLFRGELTMAPARTCDWVSKTFIDAKKLVGRSLVWT